MALGADVALQLWLDVDRPIQPRPPRERAPRRRRPADHPPSHPQMALTLAPAAAPEKPLAEAPMVPPATPARMSAEPAAPARPCFVVWLRDQSKRKDAIGELAKAVRIDPAFPRAGSADDVRSRFDRVGADGDAFAALEDAERAYDRAA